MPQSGTFGSVRGEAGAAMVTLHGHAAGNGGHGQGNPTAATGPLLLGSQCSTSAADENEIPENRQFGVTNQRCQSPGITIQTRIPSSGT